MVSKKREIELMAAAADAIEEIKFFRSIPEVRAMDTDWYIFLLYLSSQNLVKHSKTLTWLTGGLVITALGMIALAIAQLVVIPS